MRSRGRLLGFAVTLVATLSLVGTSSASAEGRIPFSRTDVTNNEILFEWTDYDTDAESTAIKFANCTSNPRMLLSRYIDSIWRQVGESPISYCLNTDGGWKNWGDLPRGSYRLSVSDTRSDERPIDIGSIIVKW